MTSDTENVINQTPAELVYGDLVRRHLQAAREEDEIKRARIYALIEEFAAIYPEAAERWEARYTRE